MASLRNLLTRVISFCVSCMRQLKKGSFFMGYQPSAPSISFHYHCPCVQANNKGVIFTTQAEMRVQKCQTIPALSGYVFFLSFMVVALVRSPRELSFFSFLTENAMALRSRHVPFSNVLFFAQSTFGHALS